LELASKLAKIEHMQEKISWQIEEYEHKERQPDWYWALGIIAVSGIVISIIYANYLFAIFIAIAAGVLYMYSFRHPGIIDIEINKKGVQVKDEFFPYAQIKSFWVEILPEEKRLLLHTKRLMMPIVVFKIADGLEEDVKHMLRIHSKEEEMKEPATQRIMDHLGF
jgi:hypothetical protein